MLTLVLVFYGLMVLFVLASCKVGGDSDE